MDTELLDSIQWIKDHNIPVLFNDITLHVLDKRPKDPVNEVISYLKSLENNDTARKSLEEGPPPAETPLQPLKQVAESEPATVNEIAPSNTDNKNDRINDNTGNAASGSDSKKPSVKFDAQTKDRKPGAETEATSALIRRQSVAGDFFKQYKLDPEEEKRRRKLFITLFPIWDIDGNGFVDLYELQQVLLQFEEVSSHTSKKKMIMRVGAALKTEGHGNRLTREAFAELLVNITRDLKEDEFDTFYNKLKGALEQVANVTKGSGRKRVLWQLFRHWDMNDNGYIEFSELEEVVHELDVYQKNKNIKRQTAKWKHKIASLTSEDQKNHEIEEGEEHKISLSEFHGMVNDIFHRLSEAEFYKTVEEMHQQIAAIKRRKREEKRIEGARQGVLGEEFFRRDSVSELLASKRKPNKTLTSEKQVARRTTWLKLFPLWDIDSSGSIDMFELQQVLLHFEDVKGVHEKKLLDRMQQELKAVGKANQLEEDDFADLMLHITNHMEDDEFTQFSTDVQRELEKIADATYGSERKRALWHLFHAWDLNQNGFLDLEELETVLVDFEWYNQQKESRHQHEWKHKIHVMWRADSPTSSQAERSFADPNALQLSLADFHTFLDQCIGQYSDEEFFVIVDTMHEKIAVVNKMEAERQQAALLREIA